MSEEKKAPSKKEESFYFIGKGKFNILGVEIVNGFKLVKELKDNGEFMKRLNHALKIGVIKKG